MFNVRQKLTDNQLNLPYHMEPTIEKDKTVVDMRVRLQSGAARWWVGLCIRCGVKSMLPWRGTLSMHFLATVCKRGAVHKTGNT